MRTKSFVYDLSLGWEESEFPPINPERTLAIAFASPEFRKRPEVLQSLLDIYPGLKVAGCSTSGNIVGDSLRDESFVVTLVQFDYPNFEVLSEQCKFPGDSRKVGAKLGKRLRRPDLRHVLIFADGLNVVGTEIVGGLREVLPEKVGVTGGLAGDADRFEKTFVITSSGISEHEVVAVGLYGTKLVAKSGTSGGWIPFSDEHVVTKSTANIVYEFDGENALSIYKEYLGQYADELPAIGLKFPLQVSAGGYGSPHETRSVLGVDHERGSLTFAGSIPEGSIVRLMCADSDALVNAAGAACDQAWMGLPGSKLALGVSCVGRRLLLGDRAEDELRLARSELPNATRLVGFYSYGEICPHQSGELGFHNQSFTVTVLGEAA